jgi:hypothetical protein
MKDAQKSAGPLYIKRACHMGMSTMGEPSERLISLLKTEGVGPLAGKRTLPLTRLMLLRA